MNKKAKLVSYLKNGGMGKSLRIRQPDWYMLGLSFVLVIVCLTLGEIFFRIDRVEARLTGPRIGSRHRQFEKQIARMEKLVQNGEQIDCIFLGNSMIWLGVDPLIVDQVFKNETGREIHCFNFGVSALPASSAGQIASMLVNRYHPKLLIYGTFARDLAVPNAAEDAYVVSDTPWLRYQNGSINLLGWLYEHSHVFQYKSHVYEALLLDFRDVLPGFEGFPSYHEYGLDPKMNVRIDVLEHPDFQEVVNKDPLKWLYHFEIQDEDLKGLQQILRQKERGVNVIVVEMPFHKTAYEFFMNGEQDYEMYVKEVEQITNSYEVPFWRISEQPDIPVGNWWDYFHLNIHGAQLFSEWLGKELGEAYLRGEINPSISSAKNHKQ